MILATVAKLLDCDRDVSVTVLDSMIVAKRGAVKPHAGPAGPSE